MRVGLPWELLLYADDPVLMAHTREELYSCLNSKGVMMNVHRTTIMAGGTGVVVVQQTWALQRGVCVKEAQGGQGS